MERPRLSALLASCALAATACAPVQAVRLYRHGTAELDRGEPQLALTDLERAAELAPRSSAIQNHLGIAYEANGRPDLALQAYERAVALDCGNDAAQVNLRELRARTTALAAP